MPDQRQMLDGSESKCSSGKLFTCAKIAWPSNNAINRRESRQLRRRHREIKPLSLSKVAYNAVTDWCGVTHARGEAGGGASTP